MDSVMCLHLITWYSQHSLIWQLVVKIFFLKPELLEQNWIHEIFCQIALCKFDFMKMFSLEERVLVMVSREMTPKSRDILGSKTRFLTFPLCVQGKWPFWLKNFSWKQFHSLITAIARSRGQAVSRGISRLKIMARYIVIYLGSSRLWPGI